MKPRLLVVELHHLGDAVMSLPFVRGAQETFDVHVLCRPATRAVYQLLADRPKIHAWAPPWEDDRPCSARQAIAAAGDEGRVLRPLEFDAAVCAWADARIEILMAETQAGQRIGFPMTRGNYYAADLPWRRHRRLLGRVLESFWQVMHPGRPLLTRQIHRGSPDQSHLRCWEQIAESLGVVCNYSAPWIRASQSVPPREGVRPILALHAHARLPSKQWPVARWRELVASHFLTDQFELVEILPEGADPVTPDQVRKIHTPDLAALATALHGADAVLCHDSLPAHLAAALGKPVVTIFGSGEPDWFAPWNNRDRVVQRRVCPLHPCIDRCGMDSYLCLEAIQTTEVLAQLQRLRTTS
ncbi:MAG: glycosyltransferase family 9 protein [Chthoniobacterales bacterium]